jgi:hypothetical protein
VRSEVEAYKRAHESADKHVRSGEAALAILRVRPQQDGKFKDYALTDELENPQRE